MNLIRKLDADSAYDKINYQIILPLKMSEILTAQSLVVLIQGDICNWKPKRRRTSDIIYI